MTAVPAEDPRRHPVLWFSGRLHQVLDELGQPATWTLSDAELGQAIAELSSGIARLGSQVLSLVAEADRSDMATNAGATNTAAWVRGLTNQTGPETSRLVRTARALESHEPTRTALASGAIGLDQARAVMDAVADIPAEHRDAGETHLLDEATRHDARALRILGRHLLEVVAPDVAETHLAARLEREEARAARKTMFSMYDDEGGTCHGRFKLSSLHGAMLRTAQEALANPARPDAIARSTTPQVLGEAFGQLIERYPADRLPQTGGINATVVVTMPLETLTGGLKAASILGTGLSLSPGAARRLACAAGVIPAVLGGKSEVLDLGRRRRLHSKPQRVAIALQQHGTCAIEDCERPSHWADAHHTTPWSEGGRTTVRDGLLLCPRHHTLAHDSRLSLSRQPNGQARFHRRE
jgi:hypothetical protein